VKNTRAKSVRTYAKVADFEKRFFTLVFVYIYTEFRFFLLFLCSASYKSSY